MTSNYEMSKVNWNDMLGMLDEVIASVKKGDREQAKKFLEALAAKKTTSRRTWGRMIMLAQDILGKFETSKDNHISEVLRALRAIVVVAMNEEK